MGLSATKDHGHVNYLATGSLLLLFLLSSILYFSSTMRKPLRQFFAPPRRKILSVAVGPVMPGINAKVLKVKTPNGIYLEIYGPVAKGVAPLIQKIKLPDDQDALFQFQGRATDLALEDLNNDGMFDIIAPTYDRSLMPHLNIYQYDKNTKVFTAYERQ